MRMSIKFDFYSSNEIRGFSRDSSYLIRRKIDYEILFDQKRKVHCSSKRSYHFERQACVALINKKKKEMAMNAIFFVSSIDCYLSGLVVSFS